MHTLIPGGYRAAGFQAGEEGWGEEAREGGDPGGVDAYAVALGADVEERVALENAEGDV